jgi:hypothetical protein
MAGLGQAAVDRLRLFLRELSPGSRALLIAELERAMLRGDDMAGAELVLSELRRSARESQSTVPRISDDARLFFRAVEPFIVDDVADHRHRGRIARSAIEPIWNWITTGPLQNDARAYSMRFDAARRSGDEEQAQQAARDFQIVVVKHLQDIFSPANKDDKAQRRIVAHLGTPRALEDMKTLMGVLDARDALAALGGELPGHINTLSGASLDNVKSQIDSRLGSHPDAFLYALIMVMNRLAAAWQLIRLATRAAGSDVAARIEETPYSASINIVLTEIARLVSELGSDLKSGRGVAVAALLKEIHDAVRGLRSELDLSGDTPWARQLAAIRADISRLLTDEINLISGRVRRLMRPWPAREIAPGSTVDPDEVAEVESLVGLVMACRNYAGELAINEVTQRTFSDLQQCLDVGTRSLLEALRGCGEAERPFRQSQVDAAVRFCAKVFGDDYAALLTKAAGVASHGERKAARA